MISAIINEVYRLSFLRPYPKDSSCPLVKLCICKGAVTTYVKHLKFGMVPGSRIEAGPSF